MCSNKSAFHSINSPEGISSPLAANMKARGSWILGRLSGFLNEAKLLPGPGNTTAVWGLLKRNRCPFIAGEGIGQLCQQSIPLQLGNILGWRINTAPKFGLEMVNEFLFVNNVDTITLATRSVLWRMLAAGVTGLSSSESSVAPCTCYNAEINVACSNARSTCIYLYTITVHVWYTMIRVL